MKKIYALVFLLSILTVLPAYALDCEDYYIPVCGNDGLTYTNSCYMLEWSEKETNRVNKVGVAYQGECSSQPIDNNIVCTAEYDPVCGVDGKTYSNKCVAENQNGIDVEHTGECKTQTNVEVEPDTILSLKQKSKLESIVQKVSSILSVKSTAIKKETYETLLSMINDKINEMKDFQMRASFTPAGARTYQVKIDIYVYLIYLLKNNSLER